MQQQVYSSKTHNKAGGAGTASVPQITATLYPVVPPVVAPARARRTKKTGIAMLGACLLIAIFAVMLAPVLARGAVQKTRSGATATKAAEAQEYQRFESLEEAQHALGFAAVMPAALPEGARLVGYSALGGSVLEVEYALGESQLLYRVARGTDNVSGMTKEHAFVSTEEAEGITRTYMGAAEDKLNCVVWAADGYSYAIVAADGLDAEDMREMAQSVA